MTKQYSFLFVCFINCPVSALLYRNNYIDSLCTFTFIVNLLYSLWFILKIFCTGEKATQVSLTTQEPLHDWAQDPQEGPSSAAPAAGRRGKPRGQPRGGEEARAAETCPAGGDSRQIGCGVKKLRKKIHGKLLLKHVYIFLFLNHHDFDNMYHFIVYTKI